MIGRHSTAAVPASALTATRTRLNASLVAERATGARHLKTVDLTPAATAEATQPGKDSHPYNFTGPGPCERSAPWGSPSPSLIVSHNSAPTTNAMQANLCCRTLPYNGWLWRLCEEYRSLQGHLDT
jgi:hypothetical protein